MHSRLMLAALLSLAVCFACLGFLPYNLRLRRHRPLKILIHPIRIHFRQLPLNEENT